MSSSDGDGIGCDEPTRHCKKERGVMRSRALAGREEVISDVSGVRNSPVVASKPALQPLLLSLASKLGLARFSGDLLPNGGTLYARRTHYFKPDYPRKRCAESAHVLAALPARLSQALSSLRVLGPTGARRTCSVMLSSMPVRHCSVAVYAARSTLRPGQGRPRRRAARRSSGCQETQGRQAA